MGKPASAFFMAEGWVQTGLVCWSYQVVHASTSVPFSIIPPTFWQLFRFTEFYGVHFINVWHTAESGLCTGDHNGPDLSIWVSFIVFNIMCNAGIIVIERIDTKRQKWELMWFISWTNRKHSWICVPTVNLSAQWRLLLCNKVKVLKVIHRHAEESCVNIWSFTPLLQTTCRPVESQTYGHREPFELLVHRLNKCFFLPLC